jgi:hypothetical protein
VSSRPWLSGLDGTDASVPLALAALVGAADLDGRAALDPLLLGYREGYLRVYRPADGLSESVRDHVVTGALPRLAAEGWILDAAADGWAEVAASGGWWADAREPWPNCWRWRSARPLRAR